MTNIKVSNCRFSTVIHDAPKRRSPSHHKASSRTTMSVHKQTLEKKEGRVKWTKKTEVGQGRKGLDGPDPARDLLQDDHKENLSKDLPEGED